MDGLQDSLTRRLHPGKSGSKEEGETVAASPSVLSPAQTMPDGERYGDGEYGGGDGGG